MIAAYVSSHGYGHATRVGEVLREVRSRADVPLAAVTAAPARLYPLDARDRFSVRPLVCDVGVVQQGALRMDEEATAARCRAFAEAYPALVRREAEWLRASGAEVVLSDVPPLGFEAAAAAGIPAVGLANFSWDWVYRHLARGRPELERAAGDAAAAYARAELLLELPFAGDLSAFPERQRIPLVARRPRHGRGEARRRLGWAALHPVALLSFGGVGLPGFDPAVLAAVERFQFVLTDAEGPLPANARSLALDELRPAGLDYLDLVAAADVVITKPGYGIVSDAIAAGTRMLYTDRGDFPEYPILVEGMRDWLACRHVSQEALFSGAFGGALDELVAQPAPEAPSLEGAAVAAERLLEVRARARGRAG